MRTSWKAFNGETSGGGFPRIVVVRKFGARLEHNLPWASEQFWRWKRITEVQHGVSA